MKYTVIIYFCYGFFAGCNSLIPPNIEILETMAASSVAQTLPDNFVVKDINSHRLVSHSRLQAVRQEILAGYGRRVQDTLWSNPRIDASVEEVAGEKGGFNGSQVTISLSQEIPINGVLSLKDRVAEKEQEEVRWRYEEELFSFSSDIYLAYHQVLLVEKREQALISFGDSAADFLEKVKNMTESGKTPKVDILRAEVLQINAKTKLNHAQSSKLIARQNLASLLVCDISQVPVFKAITDIPEPAIPSWPQLREMLKQAPLVKKLQANREGLSLKKSQLKAEVWPNPEVVVGGRRNYAENQNTLVFGLGLSLPVWNRNQGSIYEVNALIEKNIQEQKSAWIELERELFAAYQRADTSRQNLENYRTKVLPALEETFMLVRRAYEEGKVSILEVIIAQQAQLETQLDFWQEVENFYTAIASIYKIVGPWERPKRR